MATVVFNGLNRQIVCQAGVTSIDARDVYSRWKDWVASGDNTKWLHAFEIAGGDPVSPKSVTTYFFLVNGWKIKTPDENLTLSISGMVLSEDGTDPFIRPAQPDKLIVRQFPYLTPPTTRGTLPDTIANSIVDRSYLESTFNFFLASRLMAAVLSSYTPEEIIMKSDPAPGLDRIFAQSDANGDWLGISLFFSSYFLNGSTDGSSYIYDKYFGYNPANKIRCNANDISHNIVAAEVPDHTRDRNVCHVERPEVTKPKEVHQTPSKKRRTIIK